LKQGVGEKASVDLVAGFSEVGGGSFPEAKLPTWLVALKADRLTADGLIERLRAGDPPLIARIADGHVVLDPRTILPGQIAAAAQAVITACDG
jgi:L-seryl-tRNA(Ser) seleniumtransferase